MGYCVSSNLYTHVHDCQSMIITMPFYIAIRAVLSGAVLILNTHIIIIDYMCYIVALPSWQYENNYTMFLL